VQPVLAVMYLVQYMPSVGYWLMDKVFSNSIVCIFVTLLRILFFLSFFAYVLDIDQNEYIPCLNDCRLAKIE